MSRVRVVVNPEDRFARRRLVAGVIALVAVPTWLVRRVRAYHRERGSTVFIHRVLP